MAISIENVIYFYKELFYLPIKKQKQSYVFKTRKSISQLTVKNLVMVHTITPL